MLVFGAGGYAKQLHSSLVQNWGSDLVFYDDINPIISDFFKRYNSLSSLDELKKYLRAQSNLYVLAIGNVRQRYHVYKKLKKIGLKPISVISKYAEIERSILVPEGTHVLSNSILEPNVIVGDNTIINIAVNICHDTHIGKFGCISPGVTISGGCRIGNYVMIGTGAIILPNIEIGDNVTIGAGCVVTSNVANNQVVVGVPNKVVKENSSIEL